MIKSFNNDDMNFFPAPDKGNENFINLIQESSKIICKWFENSNLNGPLPLNYDFKASFPNKVPTDNKILFNDIESLINNSFNPVHPGSLANLDPPPLNISIIGDFISASLNNNLLAEELSPSLSDLEHSICNWFASKLGFGNSSGGIAASGGSLNNLNALVAARINSGLDSDSQATFIISEQAHVSFDKCAKIMGLNETNIKKIKTDIKGQMDIESLESTLKKCHFDGKKVFAVVATYGTTFRGAIDPIDKIINICKKYGIWLHVDASIGGVFKVFGNRINCSYDLSLVDSITINPQKILGITKASSLLLVSNFKSLKNAFGTGLPYIDTPPNIINRGELGVQGTRSGEIIKLWLAMRSLGLDGINKILKSSIDRKELFIEFLDQNKFDLLSGPFHIISFLPNKIDHVSSDIWTLKIREKLFENKFMLSRPFFNNRFYLRAVMGNYNTNKDHIKELSRIINFNK